MLNVNKVVIAGAIGQDPVIRDYEGKKVARLNVCTTKKYKDRNGQDREEVEWHTVNIFNSSVAESVGKNLSKGDNIYIEGELKTKKWTSKDGQEKSTKVIEAWACQFITVKKWDGYKSQTNQEAPTLPSQTTTVSSIAINSQIKDSGDIPEGMPF